MPRPGQNPTDCRYFGRLSGLVKDEIQVLGSALWCLALVLRPLRGQERPGGWGPGPPPAVKPLPPPVLSAVSLEPGGG